MVCKDLQGNVMRSHDGLGRLSEGMVPERPDLSRRKTRKAVKWVIFKIFTAPSEVHQVAMGKIRFKRWTPSEAGLFS